MISIIVSQKKNLLIQVSGAILTIGLMVGLPFIVHILPGIGNTPLGAILLPIYYAPLTAIFLFHPAVSVFAGLVVPYLNFLLTGQPIMAIAPALSVELVIFSIAIYEINKRNITKFWVTLTAFGLAKLGSGIISFFIGNFSITSWIFGLVFALPGLLVLMLLHNRLTRINIISD
jgi:hypothetical protein